MKETLNLPSPESASAIFARDPANIGLLEKACGVRAVARDAFVRLSGSEAGVAKARRVLLHILPLVEHGETITTAEFKRILSLAAGKEAGAIGEIYGDRIEVSSPRGFIRPQTPNQKKYVEAIRAHDLVVGIGPAGTGKTYLAMAMGVSALLKGEAARLILARPARETGEKLGFLPGDMREKILPYLRPLYDALYDMLDVSRVRAYEEQGVIEIAPLAYMRGRTLNHAFIILDEAQNATREQMKMFLTRLGLRSRMVITGDVTQVDLPGGEKVSGLVHARSVLKGVEGVAFVSLTEQDVVRHDLVQRIIRAYEAAEKTARGKEVISDQLPVADH